MSLFHKGLREHGYVDGQNIQIEFRSADGKSNLLPDLAAELVRLNVDMIVAVQTPCVQAAKRATKEIPIVMAPAADPLGTGLVDSLARPGGNVTGSSFMTAEIQGKNLQFIRDTLPSTRRVTFLGDVTDAMAKPFLYQIQLSARNLSLEVLPIMVRRDAEFDAAFAEMKREKVDAVIVQPSLPRNRIADLALKYQMPSISPNRGFPEAGGLMSYAGSLQEVYRRTADYVDKILRGAKPANLPVEQPTKFELVLNMRTAKALGLQVPQSVLLRADQLIE